MSDVFVSYSRADRDFVGRLTEALRTHGRESWVDWEGIAPSAEWMAEIREAIDAADTFVFVMSPDSLSSSVCAQELEHAVSAHKRIVPVVHRDADGVPIPEALAKRNWLFFRDSDDFEPAFVVLLEALDTDLERVKVHTRLLVRAREWATAGEPRSKLLRGQDLAEAERWASSPDRTLPPTEEQQRFVLASRRASSRRQRLGLAAVAGVLVLSLVLTSVALVQRSNAIDAQARAERQRQTAIEQRDIARSGDLASAALGQIGADPELGVLLAAEAVRIRRTDRAVTALRETLKASNIDLVYGEHERKPADLAFGPDGDWIASAADDGAIRIWDARSGETIRAIPLGEGAQARVLSLAADPLGRYVAAAGGRRDVRLWDVGTGALVHTFRTQASVFQVEFARDGSLLVAGGFDGVFVWDPARPEPPLLHIPPDPSGTFGADISPDLRMVATGNGDGVVRLWDASNGRPLRSLEGHEDLGFFVHFSPSSDRLVSVALDGTARVWDVRSGREIQTLSHAGLVEDATFIRNDYVATADSEGVAYVWNVAAREVVSELRGHDAFISFLAVSQGGDRIATASDDGTVRVWRPGPEVSTVDVRVPGYPTSARYGPDGTWIAATTVTGAVTVIDAATGARKAVLRLSSDADLVAESVAISPDGALVAVAATRSDERGEAVGGEIMVLDPVTGARVGGYAVPGESLPLSVAYSSDGRSLSVWSDGAVWLSGSAGEGAVALTTVTAPTRVPAGDVLASFSPDGADVAVADASRAIVLDSDSGETELVLEGHERQITAVAYDAEGSRLVTGSLDGTVRIWDAEDGRELAVLIGHQGVIEAAEFSSDGRFVVTSARDGTARIWTTDGEEIQRFRAAEFVVTSAMFAPDGHSILASAIVGFRGVPNVVQDSADRFGVLRVFECDVCTDVDGLIALASDRVTRGLTVEERQTYLSQ